MVLVMTSPFWVLGEIDGVGSCVGVLVHLEVVGRKSKRSQDHVPQFLQFTCRCKGGVSQSINNPSMSVTFMVCLGAVRTHHLLLQLLISLLNLLW